MKHVATLILPGLLLASSGLACGGRTASDVAAESTGGGTAAAGAGGSSGATSVACFDNPAAGAGGDTCSLARALLTCTSAGSGEMELCISDDAAACPGPNELPGGAITCVNECKTGEYAASCGGRLSSTDPEPPPGCRPFAAIPGGGPRLYCCACG